MKNIIKEIEKKYEFIVNAYGELMTLINRDYVYEMVNDSWCKTFNKKREDFIGKTVVEVWGEKKFNTELKFKMDLCLGGKIFKEEDTFIIAGGEKKYYAVTYYPYRNSENEVSHIIVVTNDITERKKAENALKKSEESLRISNAKKDKYLSIINSDLDKAAEYVVSLLPEPMETKTFSINWKLVSSTKLGGDSLGYHWIDSTNFAMYILDVTGHGVGSALHSVAALNTLNHQTLTNTDFKQPAQVLNGLNNAFLMSEHNSLFITMWYCVFNIETNEIDYAGAAHPPFIILKSDGDVEMIESQNPMIGIDPDINYRSDKLKMSKNSFLYFYTDGAFEVELPNGNMMEETDLRDFLCKPGIKNNDEMEKLYQYLKEINHNNNLDDDFTMIKVSFKKNNQ